MERWRNARNIAIVVAIGAGVYFIPGGGRGASAVEAALWGLFAIGIGYLGLPQYRENQFRLTALGRRHRGPLYRSIALSLFCYPAPTRVSETALRQLPRLI